MFRDEYAPYDIICCECGSPETVTAISVTRCATCVWVDTWHKPDGSEMDRCEVFALELKPLTDELSRRSVVWSLAPYDTKSHPRGVILHFDFLDITVSSPTGGHLEALAATSDSWFVARTYPWCESPLLDTDLETVLVAPFVDWLLGLKAVAQGTASVSDLGVETEIITETGLAQTKAKLLDPELAETISFRKIEDIEELGVWILSKDEFSWEARYKSPNPLSEYFPSVVDSLISRLNAMTKSKAPSV